MKAIRKLKVGLAGVMCTPFRGDKETQYAQRSVELLELGEKLGFELLINRQGLYNSTQAQRAADQFAEWGADFILLQTSSFGPGEIIYPFTSLPAYLGLWAVPEGAPTSEGGLPLNSFVVMNMYNSIIHYRVPGYTRPVKWFYGSVGQDLFDGRLTLTVQALTALVNLRQSKVGLVGGVAQGFDNLIIDEARLKEKLGVHVVSLPIEAVLERAKNYSPEKASLGSDQVRQGARLLQAGMEHALEKSGRVYLAYQELAKELDLDALAVSCWPRFQEDYALAVCSVVGQLNSDLLVTACEGDLPSAVSMLTLKFLSKSPVTLMDLSAIDEQDESLLLWHCGPTSPLLADENGNRMGSLWLFDGNPNSPIGLRNDLVLKPGKVTVMGFTPLFENLLILSGQIDNSKASYVGSRGWLRGLQLNNESISLRDLIQTIMNSSFQHHYPLAYGELAPAGLEMATWAGILPLQKSTYSPYLNPYT